MELDKIIKILIKNSMITAFELTQLGYIDEDITELINDGYLKRKGKGIYVVGNLDTLVNYAHSIEQKNSTFSKEIIDYCNLIKDTNLTPYYERFDKGIQENSQLDVISYFRIIYNSLAKNPNTSSEGNLYLLLLGYLYDLPDDYQNKLNELDLEDILVKENTEKAEIENQVRKSLYYKSYYDAEVSFKKRVSMSNNFTLEDKIEKDLISAIIEKYRRLKSQMIELIQEEKYKKLLQLLYKEDEKNFLNVKNDYLLKVVIDYLDIEKNKMLPKVKLESSNTFQAIKNKDYRKALKFMDEYKERKNINYQDPLYLMLVRINELYDKLTGKKIVTPEKVKEITRKEPVKIEPMIIEEQKPKIEEKPKVEVKPKVERIGLAEKDKNRIDKQLEEIYNGKLLVILDKIDSKKNHMVLEYLKLYDDIATFTIGQGDKQKIVVRSKPKITKRYDLAQVLSEAKKAYNEEHDYKKALELFGILLSIGTPKTITYGDYGFTLLKLHRKDEAIPYLQVATELSREHGGNIDYSDLILSLNEPTKEEDSKPFVRMNEEDFKEKKEFKIDIEHIDDLIALVHENEFNLESAMEKLGLDDDNKNYARLMYARDCYYLKDYLTGDKYLLKVEKSPNKSQRIKKLLEEVRLNKKYYKNRIMNDRENQLIFRK